MAEETKMKTIKYNEQLVERPSLKDEGFTFDIRVTGINLPNEVEGGRLIEPNAFGANPLCGRALFH